jgi:trimeric autotransporter adhesin
MTISIVTISIVRILLLLVMSASVIVHVNAAVHSAVQSSRAYPKVNGEINAVVADGVGGWYIGGSFTKVGGVGRKNIARINGDGALQPWNPRADGIVYALVVSDTVVFVGGSFAKIGGKQRRHIAALTVRTGVATAWNPCASSEVRTLAVSDSIVYAGGYFQFIGEEERHYIAAISPQTGFVTEWNPVADNAVVSLAVSGDLVYAGGYFWSIGDEEHRYIAANSARTGIATAWNPRAQFCVLCLAIAGDIVYVGGEFKRIGGQERHNIAALDRTTGLATSWCPKNTDGVYHSVRSLAVSEGIVTAGGEFSSIGGQERHNIVALDTQTGLAISWNVTVQGMVNALAISGSRIAIGGHCFGNRGNRKSSLVVSHVK